MFLVIELVMLSFDAQALENRLCAFEQSAALLGVVGLVAFLQEEAVGFLGAGVFYHVI